ncbi:MAG: Slp family lipoprotein [Pseudomonadota bacterium]
MTTHLSKIATSLLLLLALSACASTSSYKPTSAQIKHAPAIDVSYDEVEGRVNEHLGVNVRWGGQVIAAEELQDKSRLTVVAYPLQENGKPDRKAAKEFENNQFIVETESLDRDLENRFITVYGPISGEETLSNGNLQRVIPIVAAVDTKEWNKTHRRSYVHDHHYQPYHGLGLHYGFGYSRYPYYGSNYRFGVTHRYYPYRYAGRGFRISRRGFH